MLMFFRKCNLFITLTSIFVSIVSVAASAEQLFQYNGKNYKAKDLPLKYQMKLHDHVMKYHQQRMSIVEQALFELKYGKAAKKDGKSTLEYVDSLVAVNPPDEAEKKKFYQDNKSQIPYPYEKVKADITKYIVTKTKAENRLKLLDKLKTQGKYKYTASVPLAPKANLNLIDYARRGNKSSMVTVVEFADYKCPHCGEAAEIFEQLYKKYKNKVNFVFIDFPIISPLSTRVAQGAFCAGKQNKYWEFHKKAFENQKVLKSDSPEIFAASLKLNRKDFKSCLEGQESKRYVEKSKLEGERAGVSGTPTIFVNGVKLQGYRKDIITAAIEKSLKI